MLSGNTSDPDAARFLTDFAIMDRFGWTPRQIEELTESEYDGIVAVINTEAQVRKKEEEKRKRESGAVKRNR